MIISPAGVAIRVIMIIPPRCVAVKIYDRFYARYSDNER